MEFFEIAKNLSPTLALLVIGMAYAIRMLWKKLEQRDAERNEMFDKMGKLIEQNTASINKLDEVFRFFESKIGK